MATKTEQILDALKTQLSGAIAATVKRNEPLPQRLPSDGLVIIRDGNPGEPEITLGGFDSCYYRHEVEIEIYVEDPDNTTRDNAFDTVIAAIGAALQSDTTLGGLVFGMTYGQPDTSTNAVEGGKDIKSGVIDLALDYETTTPLS